MQDDTVEENENISDNITDLAKCKSGSIQSSCKVCHTANGQLHYGAVCCVSCKMFFRRNAQFDLNAHVCVFDNECQITVNSRRACRYCRLKKCFAVGMERELLRARHQCGGTRGKNTSKARLPSSTAVTTAIQPLDLLREDRSLLSTEQWSYVSNIVNAYEVESPIPTIRHLLEEQTSYPMKIRLKTASNHLLGILGSMYRSILPFLEKLPHFASLSSPDRITLMERNIQHAGGYSGILISRHVDLNSSSVFKIGFPLIYGSSIADEAIRIDQKTDADGTLVKLLLPILIFSTSSDLILPLDGPLAEKMLAMKNSRRLLDSKLIFERQNFYVDILFKYMIFRYGYQEAALRFAGLISSAINQIMCGLHAREVQIHDNMVHDVIEATERSLTVDDDELTSEDK